MLGTTKIAALSLYKDKRKMHLICAGIMTFIASFLLINFMNKLQSDIEAHVSFIPLMIAGTKNVSHFLWHAFVYGFSTITGLPLIKSAIWITATSITALALIKYRFFTSVSNINYKLIILFVALSMIAMPIYLPFFNSYLYLGQGGAGIWHNPTLLMVKPFAFLSVIFTLAFLEKQDTKIMLAALFSVLISILAKPNFILMYLPALVIYYFFIKNDWKKNQKTFLFVANVIVFSIMILAFQYWLTYSSSASSNKIVIRLGTVWSHYTPSICISILITLAFPIVVWVGKQRKSNFLLFSWLLVVFGIIQQYVFAEKLPNGDLSFDGNFFWGYICAIDILYFFSLVHYVIYYSDYKKIAFWGNFLLFCHFACGFIYLKHIFINHTCM